MKFSIKKKASYTIWLLSFSITHRDPSFNLRLIVREAKADRSEQSVCKYISCQKENVGVNVFMELFGTLVIPRRQE